MGKVKKIGLIMSVCFMGILIYRVSLLTTKDLESNSNVSTQKYTIIDDLYDEEEFYDFRQSAYNLNCVKDFYNQLNQEEDINVLSIFNQPIPIQNFKGDKEFYYNSEEFLKNNPNVDVSMKSIQINKTAFDYYELKTENGMDIDWENVNYKKQPIPIILGAAYKGIYHVGDILVGNYYSRDTEFCVVDFLVENSSIYYKSDPQFCVDNYIVIPYPLEIWEVTNNYLFESILYFAMINCDIITTKSETDFIEIIKKVSDNSKFINFSVVEMDMN